MVGMINILEFAYGSNKGTAAQNEVFASPLGYQGMKPEYTSASVDGETLTGVNGNFYLAYTPVMEGTLRVLDGTTGAVKPGATLVDAATGEVTGVADGDKAFYLYDNETVPVQAPQLKMDIKSIPITTKSRKLAAVWSFDAAYELSKELTLEAA